MIGWAVAKGAWVIFKASPIARMLAKIGAAVLLVLGLRAKWRMDGANEQEAEHKAEAAEANRKAHERMNDADLGIGATDSERIERLRGFAAKHGTRQTKGSGGGLR